MSQTTARLSGRRDDATLSASSRPLRSIAAMCVLAVVVICAVANAMSRRVDHDENQFVVSGVLLARESLLPFRDYPYLHFPNLVFVYALLFTLTDHLLLGARLFSAACAVATAATLFGVAMSRFRRVSERVALIAASAAALIFVGNPVFRYSSGVAWNHDLPTILNLLAFLAMLRGFARRRSWGWMLTAGFLQGAAVGTRSTFVFVSVVFCAVILFRGRARLARSAADLGWFAVGATVGMLPTILMFCISPKKFLFGNVRYHMIDHIYYSRHHSDEAMSLLGKLHFVLSKMIREPSNLLLAILFVCAAGLAMATWRRGSGGMKRRLLATAGVLAALCVGAILPTPAHDQYYFDPLPFVILFCVYAIAAQARAATARLDIRILGGFACVVAAVGLFAYVEQFVWLAKNPSVPMTVHRMGQEVARYVGDGVVLTPGPIIPLEGGARIYKEFATGPFAFRAASLLTPEERAEFDAVGEEDLERFVSTNPPRAILPGIDMGAEVLPYAQRRGYLSIPLADDQDLWLLGPAQSAMHER